METNVVNQDGWKATTTVELGRDHVLEIRTKRALPPSPNIVTTCMVYKREESCQIGIFFKKYTPYEDFSRLLKSTKARATEGNIRGQHMAVIGGIDELIGMAHAHYGGLLKDVVPAAVDPAGEIQSLIQRKPDALDPV